MAFDPDAYFGTVADFQKKQPQAFNPDAYFGTVEEFNAKAAAPPPPSDTVPAPAPYVPPEWIPPDLPPPEEIKATPTVFGEIGKGNFGNAARLTKSAIDGLLSPTQPSSALQVHGESGRSLLGTTEAVPADPKDDGPTRFGKAAVNATNRFVAGLTTPEMLPLLVMGGAPGIGRGIAGGFAADVVGNVPEIADRIKKSEDTKAWSQERWEAALDTSLNAVFFKGMLTHAIKGPKPPPPGERPSAAETMQKTTEAMQATLKEARTELTPRQIQINQAVADMKAEAAMANNPANYPATSATIPIQPNETTTTPQENQIPPGFPTGPVGAEGFARYRGGDPGASLPPETPPGSGPERPGVTQTDRPGPGDLPVGEPAPGVSESRAAAAPLTPEEAQAYAAFTLGGGEPIQFKPPEPTAAPPGPKFDYLTPEAEAWWTKALQLKADYHATKPHTPERAAARKAFREHEQQIQGTGNRFARYVDGNPESASSVDLAETITPEGNAPTRSEPVPVRSEPEPIRSAAAPIRSEADATKAASDIPGIKFDGVQRFPPDSGIPDYLNFSITEPGRETTTSLPAGSFQAEDLAKWKKAKIAEYDAAEKVPESTSAAPEPAPAPPAAELQAKQDQVKYGWKQKLTGTTGDLGQGDMLDPTAGGLFGQDIPGGGPGGASIHEPLAHYEMRKFAARVQADERLSAEAREAIGNRYYEPIPNVQTAAEAEALVNQRGPIESVKIITDETNGLDFRHRVTMGLNVMLKLNEAYGRLKDVDPEAAGKILDAQAALAEFGQEFGTKLGQGVQAFAMWQRMGPDGKLRMLEKQIKRVRDKFTQDHQKDVTEIVEQINEGGDVATAKEDLIDKEANRIARILSDTPAFDRLKKGKKGNEAIALIRAHLKGVEADFVERLIDLGADPQLAVQIDRMAAVNRGRIELAAKVRGIQARAKSLDNVANRIARQLSDTPDFRKGNGKIDPARELIRQHLLKPQPDFVDSLVKLGADRKAAEAIDRLAMENRRRVLVVDRAQRVRALEKLYGRTGNKVARAIPRPLWNKIIDLSDAGLLTNDSFYDLAARRLGLPALDQAGRREMARMAHEIEKAPEGIPKDTATLALSKFLARNIGFAAKDLPLGIYYGNMLSGYNTHIVNSLDTFLNVASEISTMAAANPQSAGTVYRGLLRGMLEGKNDAWLAFTRGRMIVDGKYLEAPRFIDLAEFGRKGGVPLKENTFWGRVGKAIGESKVAYPLNAWKYVGRLLASSDSIMFRGAEEARLALLTERLGREEGLTGQALKDRVNRELGLTSEQRDNYQAQAAREGFTRGTFDKRREFDARVNELRLQGIRADARADARDFAGRATYNHAPEGMLGYFASGFAKAAEKYPVLKFFVPFTQIVANVTNRGLNYTPLGFKRAIRGYSGGEPLTGDARTAMIMRATAGTIASGILLAAQQNGMIQIHGNGPSDIEKRRQLTNAGWKPYTIQVGKNFFSYTYTPIGLMLSIVGNMTDAYRYKEMSQKDAITRGVYAVSRLGSTVFSQSFLAGLSNLFKALSGESGDVVTAIKQSMAQTVGSLTTPTIVNDLYHIWDPKRYSSDSIYGDLLRRTPFAAAAGLPVLNAFGEPIEPNTNRFYSRISDDPAWQKVLKYNLRVRVPDKYTTMPDGKGGKRQITDPEYQRYLEVSGPMVKRLILGMHFENVPPELGQKMLDEASQTVRAAVLEQLRIQALKNRH